MWSVGLVGALFVDFRSALDGAMSSLDDRYPWRWEMFLASIDRDVGLENMRFPPCMRLMSCVISFAVLVCNGISRANGPWCRKTRHQSLCPVAFAVLLPCFETLEFHFVHLLWRILNPWAVFPSSRRVGRR